jgi:hypothetical protein
VSPILRVPRESIRWRYFAHTITDTSFLRNLALLQVILDSAATASVTYRAAALF